MLVNNPIVLFDVNGPSTLPIDVAITIERYWAFVPKFWIVILSLFENLSIIELVGLHNFIDLILFVNLLHVERHSIYQLIFGILIFAKIYGTLHLVV
jgi:hypothetical protein